VRKSLILYTLKEMTRHSQIISAINLYMLLALLKCFEYVVSW